MAQLSGFIQCHKCKRLHASSPLAQKCPCGEDIRTQMYQELPGKTERDRYELRNGEQF